MNALSGIDANYINEAAFELGNVPKVSKTSKSANIVKFKKILYIAVPSAAAILLILAVSLPGILSNVANKKLLDAFTMPPIIATKLCGASFTTGVGI